MLDSYSRNNYNNPQTININAVGGTIIKNYRDSFMLMFNINSRMGEALLCKNPTLTKKIKCHGTYSSWEEEVKEPVVVLQAMLCGEHELLAEVMWKEDFDKMFEPQIDKEVEE